ncbi:MAG TPA: hypothetical protein VE420_01320 [Gemmatimonadales bacterium]|jgi:hypothetical protein|nr:hypothetical protein [Gemmatimonadales bacterium]
MIPVMNLDRREAVREAGEKYGTRAADLSLVHISMAASEEAVQDHINDLVHNIREQAVQQACEDLGAVWKEAALKAAQARLEAFGGPEDLR